MNSRDVFLVTNWESVMSIQLGSMNDVPALEALYRTCFGEPPWNEVFAKGEVEAYFEKFFLWPEMIMPVKRIEGRVVAGTVAYHVCRKTDVYELLQGVDRNALYIAELFVDSAHRGRSFARDLTRILFQYSINVGFTRAVVRTSKDQFIIRSLCKSLGFQEVASQEVVSKKLLDGVEVDIPDTRVIFAGNILPKDVAPKDQSPHIRCNS